MADSVDLKSLAAAAHVVIDSDSDPDRFKPPPPGHIARALLRVACTPSADAAEPASSPYSYSFTYSYTATPS
ncbi:hypothetical protein L6Q96_16360 [Candidatus Binatia bacterium]|nr:hypothetical protein [Candidatus Binatia bacterium]